MRARQDIHRSFYRCRPLALLAGLWFVACDPAGVPAAGTPDMVPAGGSSVPGMMLGPGPAGPGGTPPSTPGPSNPGMGPTPGMAPMPGMPGTPGATGFVEKTCAFSGAPTWPVRCGTVRVPEARDGRRHG
jgi:hypothetical protein